MLSGILVLLILCLLPVLFLLPAADPVDLQERLLLMSLARLLARTHKKQLSEDQMVVEATGENGVFSKDCSPEQISMPCGCITNTD